MNDKLMSLIGLCAKSGQLICGVELSLSAVRSGKAKIVLCGSDISPRSEKQLHDKCVFYDTLLEKISYTAADIAHAAGKTANVAAVAVTGKSFADEIKKFLH